MEEDIKERAIRATDNAISATIKEYEAQEGMTVKMLEKITDRLLDCRDATIEFLIEAETERRKTNVEYPLTVVVQ